jgi:hypothetical protein
MTLLKELHNLFEAGKKDKTTTGTKERDTVGLDNLLNEPRSKGDLDKQRPADKADEPSGDKHRTASASTTARKMSNVKMHNAPEIHGDEVDTTDEIDDDEAAHRAGHRAHTTDGVRLEPTTANLPAIISKAIAKLEKGVSRSHPADIEWHMVKHLPGYLQKVIRTVGRSVFKPFTRTPIEDIQVVAHVGGGPNSMGEVDMISKYVTQHGTRAKDAELFFHKVIPNYGAKVVIYNALGFTFMFVKDFAGSYIYSWPEKDTKVDEFHSAIGHDKKLLGHDKKQLTHDENELDSLMKKYGMDD